MAGEEAVIVVEETDRGHRHPDHVLVGAAAALAVEQLAAWKPDTGPEDVPDFINHPHIQYGPTAGPYYPMTYRII